MTKRKPKNYDSTHLIAAIKKWPNPIYDKRHGYYLYLEDGRARSNQSRIGHITECTQDLKEEDLDLVPESINSYYEYNKDPIYKDTFNYYMYRTSKDKGFIKMSIQIDGKDRTRAWIKTIYIAHKVKEAR